MLKTCYSWEINYKRYFCILVCVIHFRFRAFTYATVLCICIGCAYHMFLFLTWTIFFFIFAIEVSSFNYNYFSPMTILRFPMPLLHIAVFFIWMPKDCATNIRSVFVVVGSKITIVCYFESFSIFLSAFFSCLEFDLNIL